MALKRRSDDKYNLEDLHDLLLELTNQKSQSIQPLYTLPQILGALFAILTIGGSLLAAWTNLNNQITTLKVSTDLIVAQIHKDLNIHETSDKALGARIDGHISQTQIAIDKLTNRLGDLDGTVNQLYNRSNSK